LFSLEYSDFTTNKTNSHYTNFPKCWLFTPSIQVSQQIKLYRWLIKGWLFSLKYSGFTDNKAHGHNTTLSLAYMTVDFTTNKTDNHYTSLQRWWWFSPGIPVSQPIKLTTAVQVYQHVWFSPSILVSQPIKLPATI